MDLPTDILYEDVTDQFFREVDAMVPGNVVSSPYFDMLEGSRALEVGNRRLDSGLIELTQEEIMFDAAAPRNASEVAGAMNHITMSLMSWFSSSSLPVTIYSNRYVLDFLESYKRSGGELRATSFVNYRLHKKGTPETTSYEALLVNKVLRAFVAGVCKFAGLVRAIALNVLYDEEDLTTRNMDLDLLSSTDTKVVLDTIKEAREWLQNQPSETLEVMLGFLSLASALLESCQVVESVIPLFQKEKAPSFACLSDLKTLAKKLGSQELGLGPSHSVSKFAQVDCNNKCIPYDLFLLEKAKAYDDLHDMADEIEAFVTAFRNFENVVQLESYLRYTLAPRIKADYSAVARGFFQLFLIRDDKSIAGSAESVGSITIRLMSSLCCAGTSVLDTASWKIQEEDPLRKDMKQRDALAKIGSLLDDFENAMYKVLSNYGNNRCRQRQFDNQMIVLWDTLQYNSENIEFQLFSDYGIGDRIAPDSTSPALPVTAFAYHTKLQVMIETALSGFELNLYKPFEASQMYWYTAYLAENAHANVQIRVKNINQGKLASAISLSKKIKKAKAGPKKQELKAQLKVLNEDTIPQVQKNLQYIESFAEPSLLALQLLCLTVSQILLLYQSLGANLKKPKAMVGDEELYNLRMKPWRAVEVPACPSYSEFQEASIFYANLSKATHEVKLQQFKQIVDQLKGKLVESSQIFGGIVDALKNEELSGSFFKGGEANVRLWFENLRKTGVAYQVELGNMMKLLLKHENTEEYEVSVATSYHAYFPVYTMKKGAQTNGGQKRT